MANERAMRFVITRTSLGLHRDRSPCDGAELIDTARGIWVMGFTSLGELMNFVDKHGRIIIHPQRNSRIWTKTKFEQSPYPTIEIYDNWRE